MRDQKNQCLSERTARGRRMLAPVWAAFVLVLLPVVASADIALDKAAAAKGQVVYARYCVACHGTTGRGDGSLAKDLRVPVPDITTLAERSGGQYPYDRVVRIVTHGETLVGHGTEDMPTWGDAFRNTEGKGTPHSDVAIRRVAHYIWSSQRQPGH